MTTIVAATEKPTNEFIKQGEPLFKLFMQPSNGFLHYKYRLNEAVAAEIKLTNCAHNRFTFKVKCTDNELFRINPPIGFVGKKESVVVRIIMKTAVVPQQYKHFVAVYHMKAKDQKKTAKQYWSQKPKIDGVTRLIVEFKDADAKSEKKEEDKSTSEKKDK